jgi:ribA/ribD-fused uncharacterized protein
MSSSGTEFNEWFALRTDRHGNKYSLFYKGLFSQFYRLPFDLDGKHYFCREQWMMASKARLFSDFEMERLIMTATKPFEIKRLGRLIRGFNQAVWDREKYAIVKTGNIACFSQHRWELGYLIRTPGLLVEASPTDRVWGIGFGIDTAMDHIDEWGENLLGRILTEVRDQLKQSHFKDGNQQQ